jgi:hypothetical protein
MGAAEHCAYRSPHLIPPRWSSGPNGCERGRRGKELQALREECDRLAEAIARGGPLDALLARLADRQARYMALERELSARAAERPAIDLEALSARLRAKLADWRRLLRRNVAEGRAVLRTLLVGPLRFTPIEERRRGYAFEGVIALDRLVSGVVELPTRLASPAGFEPAFWP